MSYFRELVNCIVEVLSGIYLLEHDLLLAFSAEFQENCQNFFQHASNMERESEYAELVIQFILLLGEQAMQNGESWPLASGVGPMVEDTFLHVFKASFVRWCLSGSSCSINACLDLLLALLDDEYFSEQRDSVIRYDTNLERSGCASCFLDSDRILYSITLTSLSCLCKLEVLDCHSQDPYEKQNLLDQLLCEGDGWPLLVLDFSRPEG
ncbi:hypothetical protein RchiOBHm_Chr5g0061981 [Rosa chinensis]|uniref:E3 ubiquitin-protein ligase listerin n=1 Tax=Rosa chinensis TaxID=74649 RepID=A0A2P6QI33_ROSCH|nr:hypothetical protein RchiOBHm_Chr5g0061981 [Rosa chinensis]